MPHERCTACKHTDLEAINRALLGGESVRAVARRFGLSHGAVDRHQRKHLRSKPRINIGDVARIDKEIDKLIRAQNRCKRKRDTAGALAIARETRNWFVLRQKAEVIATATSQVETSTTLTRGEALAVAEGLIESEVSAGSQEVIAWLRGLLERVDVGKNVVATRDKTEEVARVTGNVPEAQE